MRKVHNQARAADKTWSYGPVYRTGMCAAASRKGCAWIWIEALRRS